MNNDLSCTIDIRRGDLRKAGSPLGLDYVETEADPRELHAYFLGKGPAGVTRHNVRIDGGRRVRSICVVSCELHSNPDPERDDYLKIKVDREGDFSTYTLSMVNIDPAGVPTRDPFPGMDPRYGSVDFHFRADIAGDIDCSTRRPSSSAAKTTPDINYLAKDYQSFRSLMLDRLSLVMPGWTETHAADIAIAIVEVLAYAADYLSYFQDAIATEACLGTARQRISVRRHARLVDYRIHEGCNARAWLCLEASSDGPADLSGIYFITRCDSPVASVPPLINEAQLPTLATPGSYEIFEPVGKSSANLYAAHNRIEFYTWGNTSCCLPRGATRASLKGRLATPQSLPGPTPVTLHLQKDDILILEEAIGPDTGFKADADPTHRQAVRLTSVQANYDPLYQQDVVDIEWSAVDALQFPLCISSTRPISPCDAIADVSVARGNVILVDHGRSFSEALGEVPTNSIPLPCDEGCPGDETKSAGKFDPTLKRGPLTFSEPLHRTGPAADLLLQDPRKAVPDLQVFSILPAFVTQEMRSDLSAIPKAREIGWTAQPDLLESGSADRDFVTEVDDQGIGHLRFGDDEFGRSAEAGSLFWARKYRVGIGTVGNVGADTIVHAIVPRGVNPPPITGVRNPLPAAGGVDPQSVDEVKLLAPTSFRNDLRRAITADDYVALAEQHPGVQRAAATLRWMGNWYEVRVAIDPLGTDQADAELLHHVREHLHPYRKLGHDLLVVQATYVPILIALKVHAMPDYLRGHVKAALLRALGGGVNDDGSLALFHPDNFTFGQSVYASKVIAAAQGVAGVDHVEFTELRRLIDPPPGELIKGELLINPLEIAQLDNDPDFPEHGRLRIEMAGGR